MRDANQQRIGGTTVHVGDCLIWAAIFYLDSPTDYRECLPFRQLVRTTGDLVILDDVTPSRFRVVSLLADKIRAIRSSLVW